MSATASSISSSAMPARAGPSSPLGHIELKPWNDVMAINVTANFQLIRCMDPLLRQSDAGRAVFVTSGVAHKANAYLGPYAASKAALEALVRSWASETANTALRVNLFSPGPIRTRMRAQVFPGEDPMTLDTPELAAQSSSCRCARRIGPRPARCSTITRAAHAAGTSSRRRESRSARPRSSSPRKRGIPSTPRTSMLEIEAAAYWIAR